MSISCAPYPSDNSDRRASSALAYAAVAAQAVVVREARFQRLNGCASAQERSRRFTRMHKAGAGADLERRKPARWRERKKSGEAVTGA